MANKGGPSKGNSEIQAMDAVWNALSGLEPDEQKRVLNWLMDKLNLSGVLPSGPPAAAAAHASGTAPIAVGAGSQVTPKQFIAQKKPNTDLERITCLAYFLTHHRATAEFKTKALTDLNKEAAGTTLSNPAAAVGNATRDAYLAVAGSGSKQITVRGEAVVEALPDREKVKAALEANPTRRRKPAKAKAKSRKSA